MPGLVTSYLHHVHANPHLGPRTANFAIVLHRYRFVARQRKPAPFSIFTTVPRRSGVAICQILRTRRLSNPYAAGLGVRKGLVKAHRTPLEFCCRGDSITKQFCSTHCRHIL